MSFDGWKMVSYDCPHCQKELVIFLTDDNKVVIQTREQLKQMADEAIQRTVSKG